MYEFENDLLLIKSESRTCDGRDVSWRKWMNMVVRFCAKFGSNNVPPDIAVVYADAVNELGGVALAELAKQGSTTVHSFAQT